MPPVETERDVTKNLGVRSNTVLDDDVITNQSVERFVTDTENVQLENYDIIQIMEKRADSDPHSRTKSKKKVVFYYKISAIELSLLDCLVPSNRHCIPLNPGQLDHFTPSP